MLRIVAGAAAGALAGAALALLGPPPPLQPAAGAALAAGAVLLLPRIGWLLAAAALLAWLAVDAPGIALLAACAAAPVPVLLARRAVTWSLPAIAPLLGAIGLAGAWPALAGQAQRWQARAALGALGGWWVGLAEALTSDRLVLGAPREVLARAVWEGSAFEASQQALWPLVAGGGLALAALWGLAALAAAAARARPLGRAGSRRRGRLGGDARRRDAGAVGGARARSAARPRRGRARGRRHRGRGARRAGPRLSERVLWVRAEP